MNIFSTISTATQWTASAVANFGRGLVQVFGDNLISPLWFHVRSFCMAVFTPVRMILTVIFAVFLTGLHFITVCINAAMWGASGLGQMVTYLHSGSTVGLPNVSVVDGIAFANAVIPLQELLTAVCFLIDVIVICLVIKIIQKLLGPLIDFVAMLFVA